MIRFLTAHTSEVDDPRAAAAEILSRLDPQHSLLAHSAGFVFCTSDFITSGTAAAVCGALPFDVIGATTNGIALPGTAGDIMLAAAVLTGDDAVFAVGACTLGEGGEEGRITDLYRRLALSLESPPSEIFIMHPQIPEYAENRTVNVLDRLSGGKPLFGTVAVDEAIGSRSPMIIHNGEVYTDRLAMILSGNAESRFLIENVPTAGILSRPALVTSAQGNRLAAVNNMPAVRFLEKAGVISGGGLKSICAFPLLIDNHDDRGIHVYAIYGIENGVLRCGGSISEGATLRIGNFSREELLCSTGRFAESLRDMRDVAGHLVFSCYGRSVALLDMQDEIERFQNGMKGRDYLFIYSGGEFCPDCGKEGKAVNLFQQYSIISAGFKAG